LLLKEGQRVKNNIVTMSVLLLLMSLLYACANTTSLPRVHPEDVRKQGAVLPNCAECHSDSWGAMNHRAPDFLTKHRIYAGTARQTCNSCHTESFCSDCHAHKEELKPSDKFSDSPERTLPHRGDYMSQHKIDGRVNPVSCVKCHGRQNNAGCASCHK
jgi:hypothetical protein